MVEKVNKLHPSEDIIIFRSKYEYNPSWSSTKFQYGYVVACPIEKRSTKQYEKRLLTISHDSRGSDLDRYITSNGKVLVKKFMDYEGSWFHGNEQQVKELFKKARTKLAEVKNQIKEI